MKLQLFNSLENRITEIDLRQGQTINIYLCGPTVYDHVHIGNLRSVIVFDVLHRLLLKLGVKVNYVQNITDIDDKIIAKAQKEKKSEKKISEHYTKAYFVNLVRYNILFPTYSPRVTNYITEIQDFINHLLKKGTAYQKNGEVFFRIEENNEYGKLSGQDLKKLKGNFRETNLTNKEDNKDFVLWKKTEVGITWDSPWGKGRPGWHTECVVLIQKFFNGKEIDIHGGGNDLLFPHHENERIQYLAHNNSEVSNIWLHIAHINWKAEKMSKSIGNVISAKYFYQKYGTNVFRYLVLNTHHNQVINFGEGLIQQAIDYVQKIENLLKRLNLYLYLNQISIKKKEKDEEVIWCLLNNLNTTKAFFFLEETITFLNKSIDKRKIDEILCKKISNFYFILDILGFNFVLPNYNFGVKLLIREWQELQRNNKYLEADKIRNKLQKLNIL